jgi:hypothetical protein
MDRLITSKKVTRWFAPYLSARGIIRKKGFGSKLAAARWMAKQDLFDYVFGEREHDGEGWYRRPYPDDKAERIAKFAEKFPIDSCDCWVGGFDFIEEYQLCHCDDYGYARCRSKAWLEARVKLYMARVK